MIDLDNPVIKKGLALTEAKAKYATLYDFHCAHDCGELGCRKWEVDQIQERYNFILELVGEYE